MITITVKKLETSSTDHVPIVAELKFKQEKVTMKPKNITKYY